MYTDKTGQAREKGWRGEYKEMGRLIRHSFNNHFTGGPTLASTRMSPFWILLELSMMEVVVTTGAIKGAKLQWNHHHLQTNTHFYRLDALGCRPIKSQSTEGNKNSRIKTKTMHIICLRCYYERSKCSPFALTHAVRWWHRCCTANARLYGQ